MSFVFVLDTEKSPLDPVHPGWARHLLTHGKAAVWRRYPFTIILQVSIPAAQSTPLRIKLDPGSKTTGVAVVTSGKNVGTHVGRVAVRARGSFNVATAQGTVSDISYRFCQRIQRADGYQYEKGAALYPHASTAGVPAPEI